MSSAYASLYGFAFSESALRYLEAKCPTSFRGKIKRRIEKLAAEPFPPDRQRIIDVLDGEYPVYRAWEGDYRILYSVRPIIIVILDIAHRQDVYR